MNFIQIISTWNWYSTKENYNTPGNLSTNVSRNQGVKIWEIIAYNK